MMNPEKLNVSEDNPQEVQEQLAEGSFLGRYFDGEGSDIDEKSEALEKVESGVSRLEKSNALEKRYLDHIKRAKREVGHKKEDYELETGLLSKAKDRVLRKMGKDNKLSEIDREGEELKAREQKRLLRVEKARKLRAGLVDKVEKSFESELDPLYQKVIGSVIGDKIGPVLDLYKEKLGANDNEGAREAEAVLNRFVYQYKQFIGELAKVPPNERELVLKFIAESGLAYHDPQGVLSDIHGRDKYVHGTVDDFEKQLIMVHKTYYMPHGQIGTTAGIPLGIKEENGAEKIFNYNSARGTISLSINFPVVDHWEAGGSFSDRDYAVMIPYSNVKDRVINAAEEDAFIFGDLPLANIGAELIISADKAKFLTAGRMKAIRKHSGATLIVTGEKGESINQTIERRLNEKGYNFLDASKDGWYGTNPRAHKLMHDLANRDNKLFGLHACTAFGNLEEYVTQWLTNVYYSDAGREDVGNPNFRDEYFGKVNEYVASMESDIRGQGRDLNEFELEALRKIRLAAEANYQEITSIASERAA